MVIRLLPVSSRGQITIPRDIRDKMRTHYLECHFNGQELTMKPIQTKEEFLAELDEVEKNWEKTGGGLTLKQIREKHGL